MQPVLLDNAQLFSIEDSPTYTQEHSHEFLELGLVLSGHGIYRVNGEVHGIFPGDLMVTLPGDIHCEKGSDGKSVSILFLLFNHSFVPDYFLNLEFDHSTIVKTSGHLEINRIFMSILTESIEQKKNYEEMINAELKRLFIILSRLVNHDSPDLREEDSLFELVKKRKLKIVSEIREYMESILSRELNLDEIASRFYISLPHLTRIFKETTGMAPKQYLNHLRISKARELLKNTGMEIKTIARAVGYPDIQYFYRVFKKDTGMTPAQYKQQQ